ncbi:DUF262 domain-containing protein [Aeromonas veronii]|uniref:DUF262 domain-containing protein n=1 Tax=Aeromonas sp. 600886 TaxID=2712033 RepID=UPI003A28C417
MDAYNNDSYTDAEDESYPINEFQLTTTPNDFNILTIISFIKSKVFKIPAFQRHYVWDIKRASKLIESLLIGLPIPQVFLYESGRNEFLVIDGQQRLMSLYYFVSGRFPKKEKRSELRDIFDAHGYIPEEIMADDEFFQKFNLKLDGVFEGQENRFHGKNYETLGDYQMTLNLATIRNMVIKPVAGDDEDGAMFEIFNRLNSGGVNLAPQEIRMSLYQSPFIISLLELNKNARWRALLGKPQEDLRLSDVEAILRTVAMLVNSESYKRSISGFLNSFSNQAKKFTPETIKLIGDLWGAFMDACEDLEDSDFVAGSHRLSITLFESAFYASCIDSYMAETVAVNKITKRYIWDLRNDADFMRYSTGKTTRKESVLKRLERAKEIYNRHYQ